MEGTWILENADNMRSRQCEDYTETQCGAYNPQKCLMAKATMVRHTQPNTLHARDFLNKLKDLYGRQILFEHKNIVKIYSFEMVRWKSCTIYSEFCGTALLKVLERFKPVDDKMIDGIILQIKDALKTLWRNNCFPKLSSKQIRITSQGQVKIALLSRDLEVNESMRDACVQQISNYFSRLRSIGQACLTTITPSSNHIKRNLFDDKTGERAKRHRRESEVPSNRSASTSSKDGVQPCKDLSNLMSSIKNQEKNMSASTSIDKSSNFVGINEISKKNLRLLSDEIEKRSTITLVPQDVLDACNRPEPNVFIEKGCMNDFKYIRTLLPLNGDETNISEDLKVLREGAQCRLFGGKYGITQGKGRGVIALEDIEKDKFIFEYAGSLISEEHALRRRCKYMYDIESHQRTTKYKKILNYRVNGKMPTVIDAETHGNISRFLNHSCVPNVEVLLPGHGFDSVLTRIVRDGGVFRVVFKASRNIRSGEELCIDYNPNQDRSEVAEHALSGKVKCLCGSGVLCKEWILVQ